MIYNYIFILLLTCFLISSCSSSNDEPATNTTSSDHFASEQKRALDSAISVEQLLQDSADQRQRDIEEQSQQ